jgi:hypothetical protein
MNVAFGQLDIDPTLPIVPTYFRSRHSKTLSGVNSSADTLEWIAERHCIIGLYGHARFNHHSIANDYDGYYRKCMDKIWREMGYGQNAYKPAILMEAKHANKK